MHERENHIHLQHAVQTGRLSAYRMLTIEHGALGEGTELGLNWRRSIRLFLSAFAQRDTVFGLSGLLGFTKEVVGLDALPIHWLFGDDILRRLRPHVLPMKPTSAPLQF